MFSDCVERYDAADDDHDDEKHDDHDVDSNGSDDSTRAAATWMQ